MTSFADDAIARLDSEDAKVARDAMEELSQLLSSVCDEMAEKIYASHSQTIMPAIIRHISVVEESGGTETRMVLKRIQDTSAPSALMLLAQPEANAMHMLETYPDVLRMLIAEINVAEGMIGCGSSAGVTLESFYLHVILSLAKPAKNKVLIYHDFPQLYFQLVIKLRALTEQAAGNNEQPPQPLPAQALHVLEALTSLMNHASCTPSGLVYANPLLVPSLLYVLELATYELDQLDEDNSGEEAAAAAEYEQIQCYSAQNLYLLADSPKNVRMMLFLKESRLVPEAISDLLSYE